MRGRDSNPLLVDTIHVCYQCTTPAQKTRPVTSQARDESRQRTQGLFDVTRTNQDGEHASANRSSRQESGLCPGVHRGKAKTSCELFLSFIVQPGRWPRQLPTQSFTEEGTLRPSLIGHRAMTEKRTTASQDGQPHQGIGILQGALRRGASAGASASPPARNPVTLTRATVALAFYQRAGSSISLVAG